ncbi:MAG: TRAP transporter large permease subunit [Thermodesulfobacteriota bacterium]
MWIERMVRGLDRALSPLSRTMDTIGQGILALMVLLITADVVLRYAFNRPIKGSYEVVELMLVVIVYLGLAFVQIKKAHISVNMVTDKLSPRAVSILESATYLLCLGIFVLITWQCAVKAEVLRSDGTTSDLLLIPNYPFMWVVVFGSALLGLVFLKDLLKAVGDVIRDASNPWFWLAVGAVVVLAVLSLPVWLQWLPWSLSKPAFGAMGIVLLVLLLLSGMLIGPVMALIGFLGFAYMVNLDASYALLGTVPFRSASIHSLSTIPLFVLMGTLCFHAELSSDFYHTMRNWMGRLPGGLAMATIGGCAGFAAVSGSSLATAVTMGSIALPEMRRYRYADTLACGAVASGGTIGILIPPSIVFIIYAGLTEESIGKLFMAGFIPGILEAIFYILTIYVLCKVNPDLGPPGPASSFREKVISLKDTWGILVLFLLVIGGIYVGLFTATEAAGVGAFGALLLGFFRRKLTRAKLLNALNDACKNTAMLMLMLMGADIFSYFLTMSQIPFLLSDFVVALPMHKAVTMWAILFVYVILGAIMPVIPAVILTIPIFFPVVTGLGYDPIWFGVIVVMIVEIGQITPPVGINVFALAGVAKDVPLGTIFKGIFPFLVADIVRLVLVFFFPALALCLPSLMGS